MLRLTIKVLLIRAAKKCIAFLHPEARTADVPVSHRRTRSASRQGDSPAGPRQPPDPPSAGPRRLKNPPRRACPPEHFNGSPAPRPAHPLTVAGAPNGPGHAPEPPHTAVEAQLQQLWQAEFDRPVVGIRDDFFALGGSSERAARLMRLINGRFGLALPDTTVLMWSTIAELAEVIENCRAEVPRPWAARRKWRGRKSRSFSTKPVLPWVPQQRDRTGGEPW